MKTRAFSLAFFSLVASLLTLAGCGGNGGGVIQPPPPTITVAVTPKTATVASAGTQQFNAAVQHDPSNAGVTWSTTAGTVSVGGLFTAPTVTTQTAVTVTATSKADTTKSDFATVTVNAPSTITSVSATCNPTTIQTSQTSQCTAVVLGTGSFSTNVTWSTNIGTISSSGLLTAPASAGTARVTATSTQNTGISGSTNVTVTAANQVAVISSAMPPVFYCNDYHLCGISTVKLIGSNFTSGCSVTLSPQPDPLSVKTFISSTEIDLHLQFDGATYAPGQFVTQACVGTATASNNFTIGMMTNRNVWAQDFGTAQNPGTGNVFLLDVKYTGLSFTPTIYPFKGDGTPLTTFRASGTTMALDDKTHNLVFSGYLDLGIVVTDQNGTFIGGGNGNGQWGLDVKAKGGFGCEIQPQQATKALVCIDLVNDLAFSNPLIYSALQDPCALAMVQNGTEVDALVLDCANNTLSRISVPNMNLKGALVLNQLGSSTSGNTSAQVAALSSGTVAVISPADGASLLLIGLNSMTETAASPVSLDGYPDGIVENEAANKFEVFFASQASAVPTGAELVNPTGGKTLLGLTSSSLPLGRGVSADGAAVYLGDRGGKLSVLNNQ